MLVWPLWQVTSGGKAGAGGFSATEVLQYTKYFQLVPAQGLRVAYDNMVGSFEAILREVRTVHQRSACLSESLQSHAGRWYWTAVLQNFAGERTASTVK